MTKKLTPSLSQTQRPVVTEELLVEITRRIIDAFHPERVILFGSYAYGIPTQDSDIDLLVIMDSNDAPAERIRKVRGVAKIAYLPMDVLVKTPTEMRDRLMLGDFFLKEVTSRGRLLYEHDTA